MLLTIETSVREPDILVAEIAGRILPGRECTHVEDTVLKAIHDSVFQMTHLDSESPFPGSPKEA